MATKLTIVKDDKDHITKIAVEIIQVLNLHLGSGSVSVFGIHDFNEFVVTNKPFVLFLLTDETKSLENHVPNWITVFNQSKQKIKYLVVRESNTSFEQNQIANQTSVYRVESETGTCNRSTIAENVINVDQINSVLKWWPNVIKHVFKTRNATSKVSVVTEENESTEDSGSDINAKMHVTIKDTTSFLQKWNAIEEKPVNSNTVLLFVVGDSKTFYENHKYMRQKKINGCKIILILVRGRNAHELRDISSSQFSSLNMISDVLQIMVDLGIINERKTLTKTVTVNPVETAIATHKYYQQVKVSWRFRSKEGILSNAGKLSIQYKNESNGEWEEISSIEASSSTCETVISNVSGKEWQILYEDAKTGHMSSPVCVKSVAPSRLSNCSIDSEALQKCLMITLWVLCIPELIASCMILMLCCIDEDWIELVLAVFIVMKLFLCVNITLIFGAIYLIPTVLNFIIPAVIYIWLFKVRCKCSNRHIV